jgi:hypothetical protein
MVSLSAMARATPNPPPGMHKRSSWAQFRNVVVGDQAQTAIAGRWVERLRRDVNLCIGQSGQDPAGARQVQLREVWEQDEADVERRHRGRSFGAS